MQQTVIRVAGLNAFTRRYPMKYIEWKLKLLFAYPHIAADRATVISNHELVKLRS